MKSSSSVHFDYNFKKLYAVGLLYTVYTKYKCASATNTVVNRNYQILVIFLQAISKQSYNSETEKERLRTAQVTERLLGSGSS